MASYDEEMRICEFLDEDDLAFQASREQNDDGNSFFSAFGSASALTAENAGLVGQQAQPVSSRFEDHYMVHTELPPFAGSPSTCARVCSRMADGSRFVAKCMLALFAADRELEAVQACAGHPTMLPLAGVFRERLSIDHPLLPVSASSLVADDAQLQSFEVVIIVTRKLEGDALGLFGLFPGSVLPNAVIAQVLRALVAAVSHCHAQGYVHADVKLENVLRDEAGNFYLIDFGHALRAARDAPTGPFGTPSYLPPEALHNIAIAATNGGHYAPLAPSMDVFMIGVAAFVMATNVLPFGPHKTDPEPTYTNPTNTICPFVPDAVYTRILNFDVCSAALARMPLRMQTDPSTADLWELIRAAMHPDPTARPSAADLRLFRFLV